jgi:hypothetical protein
MRARDGNQAAQERSMFESVLSKVFDLVGSAVRGLGAVARRAPRVVPLAILAAFAVWG